MKTRTVTYDTIHALKPEYLEEFVDIVDPQPREEILDAMCGYGEVAKTILQRCQKKSIRITITLLDASKAEIARAKENLPHLPDKTFIVKRLPKSGFPDNHFDKIVVKMGLYENPKEEQLLILKEFYRILKKGGKLITWHIMPDEKSQNIFQKVVRKKDELAGFTDRVERNYFFTEREFKKNLEDAGFKAIKNLHDREFIWSARVRLQQELGGDEEKLEELNAYVKKIIPRNRRRPMKFKEMRSGNILFSVSQIIYTATK